MKSRKSILAGIAAIALGPPAFAQTASSAPEAERTSADESGQASPDILVVGLRRATTAQNTAATINVVTADQLAKSGVQGSLGLQFQTPGLVISQDLGLQTQIYIRGIGSNLQGIAVSNSVATYLDGVYIPNTIQSAQTFNDIERIEVLKGPQATLYGRNATGGTINIITERPTFQFHLKADASYGNYDDRQVHLSGGGTIVKDLIAVNVALQYSAHDGYAHNLFPNKNILALKTVGARGLILITPTPDLKTILRADYTKSHTSDFLKLYPSTVLQYVNNTQYFDPRPRYVYYDIDNREPVRDSGFSGTLEWATPLGKITSVTSRRIFKAGPLFSDSDQIPVAPTFFPARGAFVGSVFGSTSFYHETYLSTDTDKPFSAIMGGNYFHENAYELKRQLGPTLAVPQTDTNRYSENSAYAGYIDSTLKLSDQLSVVGGIRYTHETRDYEFYRIRPTGAPTFNDATYKNWSPRIGVEFRPQTGLLLFGTVTTGFKSGGFNTDTPTNSFNPEKIISYEAGVKTTLFGALRVSASGFYYDYR